MHQLVQQFLQMINKQLDSKNKINQSISLKRDKFTPLSSNSVMSPDSFGMTPNDYNSDGFSAFDFPKSNMKINKRKKSKVETSKELLARFV